MIEEDERPSNLGLALAVGLPAGALLWGIGWVIFQVIRWWIKVWF